MENFSLVIPVYNEANLLKNSINHIIAQIKQATKSRRWEIILVENGSQDASRAICRQLVQKHAGLVRAVFLKQDNYGQALRKGLQASRFAYLATANVDFFDLSFLKKGLKMMSNCDIVVGSKTLIASQDKRSLLRRQLSYWFNVFLRLAYNYQGTDTHGLKVMKASSILPLTQACYHLSELWDTQLLLHASRDKLIYTEFPVSAQEVRPTRYSLWKRFRNVCKDLGIICKNRYL